jgi:SAM-dependent methyltransferase
MDSLRLPQGTEFYIALQRPHHAWRSGRRLRVGHGLYVRHLMRQVERRRRDRVALSFSEGLARDLESLRPWLPERATSVLDIGCGLGGIDILLHRHYAPDSPRLTLLDRDGVSPDVFYGYEDDAAHYTSLADARRLLEENGVPPADITTCDADRDGYPATGRFDLVISLISWGFHYPIETYLDDVERTLAPGGTVILDVRGGAASVEALGRLGVVETVETSRSRTRLCVRR